MIKEYFFLIITRRFRMVIKMNNLFLNSLLIDQKKQIKSILHTFMLDEIKKRCEGCIYNCQSQRDHSYCLLDCEEDIKELE